MPIMAWLHYADHALDPIRRSSSGSNEAIADNFMFIYHMLQISPQRTCIILFLKHFLIPNL